MLIGDIRKKGVYYSPIKDLTWFGALEAHVIKAQHNCVSSSTQYSGSFIPIVHEHLLVFRKDSLFLMPVKRSSDASIDIARQKRITWKDLLYAYIAEKGPAATEALYAFAEGARRAEGNSNVKAKVRQTLNTHPQFNRTDGGMWALAA